MYCFFTTSIFYSEITLLPLGCHRFFPAPTSWQLRSVKTAASICLCKYVMMGICGNAEEVITRSVSEAMPADAMAASSGRFRLDWVQVLRTPSIRSDQINERNEK
jgi:hypothetical protein